MIEKPFTGDTLMNDLLLVTPHYRNASRKRPTSHIVDWAVGSDCSGGRCRYPSDHACGRHGPRRPDCTGAPKSVWAARGTVSGCWTVAGRRLYLVWLSFGVD